MLMNYYDPHYKIIQTNPPRKNKINNNPQISKSLAHMLRHAAGTNNLEIRKDGYAKLSSIMKTKDFKGKHTIEQVMAVCYYDSKSRFSMIREAGVNTEYLVRANQVSNANMSGSGNF